MTIFTELSVIILLATLLSFVMRVLKQPLIVGYILTGIIAGPYVLNIVHSHEVIELFSKIGMATLLFIVGLNLNPTVIREIGKVSLIVGLGQILVTTLAGFGIALYLGLDRTAALYTALALTFSSTIIILKLLSDKGDLHKLYGKIAIGFLIVQDIVATIIMLFVSSTRGGAALTDNIVSILSMGIGLTGLLIIISIKVLPQLTKYAAASPELLFLFSLSWGLGLGSLFAYLGLSVEIGALVGGVMLSVTPFAYEISARLRPIRDFFVVIFFIFLGSQMILADLGTILLPTIILTLFVVVGNPIIMIVIMNLLGYNRKTGFMTGVAIAQISEFSLILATVGFQIGHIDRTALSLITFIGLITITLSTYMILHAETLYTKLQHLLKFLELRDTSKSRTDSGRRDYDTILFGYDRVGHYFSHAFAQIGHNYLVIDHSPASIDRLLKSNIPHQYGDASDMEFVDELQLKTVKLAVSTIPDNKTNMLLASKLLEANKKALFVAIAHDVDEAEQLYKAGAAYVIMPHYLGARYAANLIAHYSLDAKSFAEERERHLSHIRKIKQ